MITADPGAVAARTDVAAGSDTDTSSCLAWAALLQGSLSLHLLLLLLVLPLPLVIQPHPQLQLQLQSQALQISPNLSQPALQGLPTAPAGVALVDTPSRLCPPYAHDL